MNPADPRAALLASLVAERFNGGGWARAPRKAPAPTYDDSETTCARRRRELADAWTEHNERSEPRVVSSG